MNCWLCKGGTDEAHWTNCRLLCEDCFDKPRHRYYYINRPPGIGCQPDGFVDRRGWMPAKEQEVFMWGEMQTRRFLGWVEYPAPLESERVWKWELHPADHQEAQKYCEWREENGR